jgi:head-tail adaptor
MSLLDAQMTPCVFVDKKRTDDGEGGYVTEWVEGASFHAAITIDQSLQAETAMRQGVTGVYTVTVKKHVRFDYHDAFKRLGDGKIFRITSRDDSATPESATINARTVKAEEWSLPT